MLPNTSAARVRFSIFADRSCTCNYKAQMPSRLDNGESQSKPLTQKIRKNAMGEKPIFQLANKVTPAVIEVMPSSGKSVGYKISVFTVKWPTSGYILQAEQNMFGHSQYQITCIDFMFVSSLSCNQLCLLQVYGCMHTP